MGEADIKRFVSELATQSQKLLDECRLREWWSPDAEVLASHLHDLDRELATWRCRDLPEKPVTSMISKRKPGTAWSWSEPVLYRWRDAYRKEGAAGLRPINITFNNGAYSASFNGQPAQLSY